MMKEQLPQRFTTARIVLFCYEQHLYDQYFRSDKLSLCVELPIDVIHRMDTFKKEGTVSVHGREIVPIFFTSKKSLDDRILDLMDDNFELFRQFIELDVINGNNNIWFFADKKITDILLQTLKIIQVPEIYVYERKEEDVPKICELRFVLSQRHQMMVPVISVLDSEAICKN